MSDIAVVPERYKLQHSGFSCVLRHRIEEIDGNGYLEVLIVRLIEEIGAAEATTAELTRKLEELTPLLSNAIRERNKYDVECDRLEAKVEDLEAKLAAMTEDRDLWQSDHDGDCPYKGQVDGQQSLIRELGDALNKSWQLASAFSMRPNASCHPDVPYAEMNETAKTVMHTTAQQIAWEIKDMVDAQLAKLPKDTVTHKL